uniref:Lactamase, beta-like 1b n=1 Tax=Electrophorus electricus TaxID=8005 RepID=A0A4W4FUA1_ELEEL
ICPCFPEPTLLEHPLPRLKEALQKVITITNLRKALRAPILPTLSTIILYNNTVLRTGNFGKRNGSNPSSAPPDEYSVYRIASISKIFPTLMLYQLWENGNMASLDDSLEKYVENFSIKNPLGGGKGRVQISSSGVTLRRMTSQLSGLPRRLPASNLLWKGKTQAAINLLQDDVLVADPGTKCHYSNLAFSLLAHVLAEKVVGVSYQRWITDSILNHPGLEHTAFDNNPAMCNQMAVGMYASSRPMVSTAVDLAKLAMALLGAYRRKVLGTDTLKDYFANRTGMPWEVKEQFGYELVWKDGDLDGYFTTLSLLVWLKLGLVLLMASARPQNQDVEGKAYSYLIPAMERAFREAKRTLNPPLNLAPYVGFFTYANIAFYDISTGPGEVLVMQKFVSQIKDPMPERYRTIKLNCLVERVFRVVSENEYPCVLHMGRCRPRMDSSSISMFDSRGISHGFDAPGLNTYSVIQITHRPTLAV